MHDKESVDYCLANPHSISVDGIQKTLACPTLWLWVSSRQLRKLRMAATHNQSVKLEWENSNNFGEWFSRCCRWWTKRNTEKMINSGMVEAIISLPGSYSTHNHLFDMGYKQSKIGHEE